MTDSRNEESAAGEASQTQPQQQPLGVAGGVLGIVGIVMILAVAFLGGLLCLLALIFGIIGASKGRSQNLRTGMAVTGIWTGAIGTLYIVVTRIPLLI